MTISSLATTDSVSPSCLCATVPKDVWTAVMSNRSAIQVCRVRVSNLSLSKCSIAVFLFRGFVNRSRNVSVLIFHFYLSSYSYG